MFIHLVRTKYIKISTVACLYSKRIIVSLLFWSKINLQDSILKLFDGVCFLVFQMRILDSRQAKEFWPIA